MAVAQDATPARLSYGLLALLAVVAAAWCFKIEFYPLTAMQMYSLPNRTGRLVYHRLFEEYQDGARAEMRPERFIPALRDTRYRKVLRQCFRGEPGRARCETFLRRMGELRNAQQRAQVHAVEVEKRAWAYVQHPSDPAYGATVARVRVVLAPPTASPQGAANSFPQR